MDVYKILIVITAMFMNTANISAIGADSLCTLLDKGTYLLNSFLYLLGKLLYILEFMSLVMKDLLYMTCHLMKHSRVVMDGFLREMVIHYFLINLNTDMMPRAMDVAAATMAIILC